MLAYINFSVKPLLASLNSWRLFVFVLNTLWVGGVPRNWNGAFIYWLIHWLTYLIMYVFVCFISATTVVVLPQKVIKYTRLHVLCAITVIAQAIPLFGSQRSNSNWLKWKVCKSKCKHELEQSFIFWDLCTSSLGTDWLVIACSF